MERPGRVAAWAAVVVMAAAALGAAASKTETDKAMPPQALIVNGARAALIALQIKESSLKAVWRDNLLAGKPLGIQKQMQLDLPDKQDCFFDMKATFEDGRRLYRPHVNLCRLKKFTVTDF